VKEKLGEEVLPTPYDVPSSLLIKRLARYLKDEIDAVSPPEWASFVKTGTHAQRPPQDPDWWFTRCASLLRKIYVKGPIGVQRLRSDYGGRLDRGVKPEHARKGSGGIIRKSLQQLQTAGFVQPLRRRGRVITNEGTRLLDRLSTEIKRNLEETVPDLKKY
jgi:small subunit ribosomal protein S19e